MKVTVFPAAVSAPEEAILGIPSVRALLGLAVALVHSRCFSTVVLMDWSTRLLETRVDRSDLLAQQDLP